MNKRFLGLGFTFTAQDRGLGKKLTEYSDTLRSIKDSMDSIKASGANGVVMGEPVSQAKMSGPRTSSRAESTSTGTDSAKPRSVRPEKPKGQVVYSQETKDFLGKLKSALPKNLVGGLAAEIDELGLKFNSHGDMLDESKKRLLEHASKMVEAQKSMKKTKFIESLRAASDYLRDVGRSFSNLLDSFGIRLREMIPPQLSAMFGVIKSVVAGPINLLKSITGNTMSGLMKKQVNAVDKLKSDLNEQIGNKSGPSLKEILMDSANPEDEKKKGFFSKILDLFGTGLTGLLSPLKFLLGPLGRLASFVASAAISFGTLLASTEGRAAIISRFTGAISKAAGAMSRLGKWISSLGQSFSFLKAIKGSFLIASITATISGLLEKLDVMKYGFMLFWDGLKEFGSGLGAAIGVISGKIWDGISGFLGTAVSDAAGAFRTVFNPFIEVIVKVFELFEGVYKRAGNLFGDLISIGGDVVGGVLKSAGKDMKSWAENQRKQDVPADVKERADTMRATSDAILERGLDVQQQEQKRTNDLLQQLIQMQTGTTNNVNVSLKTKGSWASIFAKAEIEAGQSAEA